MEMGRKTHDLELQIKEVEHNTAVTLKKAKAEELESSLKEEALERKWSHVEAANEHAEAQLRVVHDELNEMRERAFSSEAEARVTAEEITEVQKEAFQMCRDFENRKRDEEEASRGYAHRQRELEREKATALDQMRRLEEELTRLEAQNEQAAQGLIDLQKQSAALLKTNSDIRAELSHTQHEAEVVGNRSLDFLARVKASRHSK